MTTSQFVTAPKHHQALRALAASLTTSQFVTAPKQAEGLVYPMWGLTTSQFVTAPKQLLGIPRNAASLTTSQFVTAPKPWLVMASAFAGLTTSQFVTAPKPLGQNPLCGRTDSRLAHSFMIEESPCQYTFFSRIRKPHRRERSQAAARSIPEKPPVDRTLGPHLAPKNSSN